MTRILAFIFAAIEVWHARHTRRYNTSHHSAVTTRTHPTDTTVIPADSLQIGTKLELTASGRYSPGDSRPHSRACGMFCPGHGPECHANCPTCGGKASTKGQNR